jgi:RND family efflux transporter MFP subunit
MTHRTHARTARSTTAAGLLLAGSLALSACSPSREVAVADTRSPADVTVEAARVETGPRAFVVGGQVSARTTAVLVSRIFAEVQDVLARPGDRVRAGQVLVRLDARDLQAQRARAEAGVAAAVQTIQAATTGREAAEAGLTLAAAAHRRIAELRGKNSATPSELDQAVSGLKAAESQALGAQAVIRQAEAGAEEARASLRGASVALSYASITAPFDGVVTEKRVEVGNTATPGVPLLTVEDAGAFRLDVRVDESRVSDVDRSRPVEVAVDSLGHGSDATWLPGTISEVERALDPGAHAFLVKIALPQTTGLQSGMFGRARFHGAARQALVVAADSVVRRGQLTSVFVVGRDNRARLRLVQIAGDAASGDLVEIAAGLDAGEAVVRRPPVTLVDGAPVRPVVRSAATAAGREGGR